ncbi:hypothetical protein [Qipengyuania flava]|uniref:hypothetical protein n=1 Tax=Qipengyuania flava TaxID=192812 RepID=UPI00137B5BAC
MIMVAMTVIAAVERSEGGLGESAVVSFDTVWFALVDMMMLRSVPIFVQRSFRIVWNRWQAKRNYVNGQANTWMVTAAARTVRGDDRG